jgi:hypothetical protein
MLGVLNSAGAAICLATCRFTSKWNVALAIDAVTGTRRWGFCLFAYGNDFDFVVRFSFDAAAATVIRLPLCKGS